MRYLNYNNKTKLYRRKSSLWPTISIFLNAKPSRNRPKFMNFSEEVKGK